MSSGARAWSRETVIGNRDLVPGTFLLETSWYGPEPDPGQFFMLRAGRSGVLLGRPLSVQDASVGRLSFAISERGQGTGELRDLRVGEGVMVEGPLGSGWAVSPEVAALLARGESKADGLSIDVLTAGSFDGIAERVAPDRDRPLALVGGGIGLAPLFFLARRLPAGSYRILAGYRGASWGLEDFEPECFQVFSEDGSEGRRGRVLDGFDPRPYSAVLSCGPEPMLRAVATLSASAGIPAWLSLETRMACGVGACLGCTVRTVGGNRRACVEGPVFPAEEVIFDE